MAILSFPLGVLLGVTADYVVLAERGIEWAGRPVPALPDAAARQRAARMGSAAAGPM